MVWENIFFLFMRRVGYYVVEFRRGYLALGIG